MNANMASDSNGSTLLSHVQEMLEGSIPPRP